MLKATNYIQFSKESNSKFHSLHFIPLILDFISGLDCFIPLIPTPPQMGMWWSFNDLNCLFCNSGLSNLIWRFSVSDVFTVA